MIANSAGTATFEYTVFEKLGGGPMSKGIRLDGSGGVVSNGSACVMSRGTAARARVTLEGHAMLITGMDTAKALALGRLRDDLPDQVNVVTKSELQKLNGTVPNNIVARTADFIVYQPNEPGLLLVDFDQKAMPEIVRTRIDEVGGLLAALKSVLPQLVGVGAVLRSSTSSCLYREDTGERLQGSGGAHYYVGIVDASDAERALRVLHDKCVLSGYGWMMIGRGGDLLRRSLVDRMVAGPERPVFEGAPVLEPPLCQEPRPAQVFPGDLLDTRSALPELTISERVKLEEIERAEIARLKPEAEKVRAKFIEQQAVAIAARIACTTEAARYVIERQCHGTLLPPIVLPFDAEEFFGCTVADVLADPQRFDRATLADPIEDVEYGVGKATVLLKSNGEPWVHSFAHGKTSYTLRYDADTVERAILTGVEQAAADIAVRMLAQAEVNRTDEDRLIGLAAKRGKVGKRAISQRLKDLRSTAKAARANEAQAAAAATSLPEIVVVQGLRHEAADAGIAAMHAANVPFYQRAGGLVRVCSTPARTSDGKEIVVPGVIPVPSPMLGRALNTSAVWRKPGSEGEAPARIDCPRDVVEEVAAMAGYWPFPPLVGVIGTQTMRPDGSLLSIPGYDLSTGLYLHQPPPMLEIPERPTWQDAEEALSLLNGLLTEFPFADNVDRSVGMSMLVTPVLRAALGPAVPMHVVSAPSAGSGKSYLCDLGSVISIGERCPVTAVAPREEETEKRLIGSALAGHPIIALDNCNGVLSGDFLAQLTERPVLDLRALGSSDKARINNVFTVYATGNNIIIHGDLTRRAARAKLDANTADPLTRAFTSNPVQAVLADRGRYVAAILTIARAYLAAGMPNKPHRVPSYELWSDLVCGALLWLGWPNPADTMTVVRQEDPLGSELATILAAWPNLPAKGEVEGHTADDLIAAATAYGDNAPVWPEWLEAVQDVGKNKLGQLDSHTLGRWLARNRDRMIEARKLVRTGTPTRPRWKVEIHTSREPA
jgi:hypothetical protein